MKTILLIDDDAVFRALTSQALAAAGWEVLVAEDGETGIKLALLHHPAAVLCDLLMPRCNGFQVCRALRSHQDRIGRPRIIVTTGSAYDADRRSAFEAGADEYLVKPVRIAELIQVLDQSVSQEPPPPSPGGLPEGEAPQATRVRFWGVRGSIASPGPGTVRYGGNTPCVEVRADGEIIALDAGTGIRPFGRALMNEFKDRPINLTILISHTHWDHIQGFPFFVPAYNPRNKVRMLGYEGARKGLEITLSAQMESPYFPVGFEQMPGNITIEELRDTTFNIGRVQVRTFFLNHPGICTAYRLFTSAGSISYLSDYEPYHRFMGGRGEAPLEGEQLAYAQSQEQRLANFIAGSDVLIIDCQYSTSDYERHVGWGHSSIEDSVALGVKAGVRRCFPFHYEPTYEDRELDSLIDSARQQVALLGSDMIVEGAREGVEVVLEPAKAGQAQT